MQKLQNQNIYLLQVLIQGISKGLRHITKSRISESKLFRLQSHRFFPLTTDDLSFAGYFSTLESTLHSSSVLCYLPTQPEECFEI